MYHNLNAQRRFIIYLGILITTVILGISFLYPNAYKKLDYKVYDVLTSFVPEKSKTNYVTIIDVDDRSLAELGQWPWARYKLAEILDTVKNNGAVAIGLDIIFPEEDRTSIKNIKQAYKDDFNLDIEINNVPEGMEDNDNFLAEVLSSGPFILSSFFIYDKSFNNPGCVMNPLKVFGQTGDEHYLNATGMLCSITKLAKTSELTGFFNAMSDEDGIMRRITLITKYKGAYFPNLSLATFLRISGNYSIEADKDINGQFIKAWNRKIYLDESGSVLINFRENRSRYYKYLSASDIFYGRFSPDDIKGKVVFVGSSATGLNDLHTTSFDTYFPGIEVHATFVDNLLNGDFFYRPAWGTWFSTLSIIFFGISISFLLSRIGSLFNIIFLPMICLFVLTGTYIIIYNYNMYVSPTTTLVTIIFVYLSLTFVKYFIEEKRSKLWINMLTETQEATIRSMASVAETRDPETGGHIYRTQNYVKALAEHLLSNGKFTDELNEEIIKILYNSAPLHDVGKVGIPDGILLKPGKLTDEEFTIMKSHASLGGDIIGKAEVGMMDSSFLHYARQIAVSHHEKWDGSGYPNGLAGSDIPLSGRLMAVADVYDALISKRHYKDGMSHEKAASIIIEGSGKHFDPEIVQAFIEIESQFIEISIKFNDQSEN